MDLKILSVISISIALVSLLCIKSTWASYGGGSCGPVPAAAPGASTLCTAAENGFCLLDTIDFDKKLTTGVCYCNPGFTGEKCQILFLFLAPTSTTTTSSSGKNAILALALGGALAYLLSKGFDGTYGYPGSSGGYGASNIGLYPATKGYTGSGLYSGSNIYGGYGTGLGYQAAYSPQEMLYFNKH
ncbi:uncharacterized protein LOC134238476 [Saccostrea cucullata]|uniref:uncharacterized protein LOC134238476 n=1 Tax=Saccostrea cuccullata TaxID=36930 RepID=UPI002ED04BB2